MYVYGQVCVCMCVCQYVSVYMIGMFYLSEVAWYSVACEECVISSNMRRTNYLIAAIKILSGFLQKSRFSIEILGQTKPSQTSGLPPLDS